MKDRIGNTPLAWAARNGHEEVVKMLSRDDMDPNKAGEGRQTPLWLAACYGHERVVKILLGRGDIDP